MQRHVAANICQQSSPEIMTQCDTGGGLVQSSTSTAIVFAGCNPEYLNSCLNKCLASIIVITVTIVRRITELHLPEDEIGG